MGAHGVIDEESLHRVGVVDFTLMKRQAEAQLGREGAVVHDATLLGLWRIQARLGGGWQKMLVTYG